MYKKILIPTIFMATFFILTGLASSKDLQRSSGKKDARPEKLRILVDKVMQPEEGWTTKEWMVKEAAGAGFNVYSPRKGYDKLKEVEQVAQWCRKYGISYMPWMRGTLEASAGLDANGKRYVPANGIEQPIYSPNSDVFWEWMNHYIIAYARIGVKNKSLIGVFLDFENYVPMDDGYCYELSYDDGIIAQFSKARRLSIPVLPLRDRKKWLERQKLHKDFEDFQIGYWRAQCAFLRKKIDQINPGFKFCIYPEPDTPFIARAGYLEWATKKAPLIMANHQTYSRPKAKSQMKALQKNHDKLVDQLKIANKQGIPFLFIGGIDPIAPPSADPEFCGKNAVMISELSDGYWVFYEGPKYAKDHPEYFKWFAWANKAIIENRFDVWHEPRKMREP